MSWKEDKKRIINHSSNIFYHVAIGTMILCYSATIVFAFDIASFIGTAIIAVLLCAIWLIVALIGCVTFLIFIDGYRSFLMSVGEVIISLFNEENAVNINNIIIQISHYYPILAVLPPIAVALMLILKGVNRSLGSAKREIIVLSIMGVIYIISLVLSILLISRFN